MANPDFDYRYDLTIYSNKKLANVGAAAARFPLLQKYVNLLEGLAIRGGALAAYAPDADAFVAASGNVLWASAAAHGSGTSNAAFTFTAGSSGACTVVIAGVSVTITGSGTAATDATALAAAIAADSTLSYLVTATANSGDVRLVAVRKGLAGNAITTTVSATGGGKLTAASGALTGGTPTGALGTVTVAGVASASLGNANAALYADDQARAIAAVLNASALSKYVLFSVDANETDCQVQITSLVNPAQASLGNLITLAASVGTASGGTLSGGVDATAAVRVY